MSTLRWIIQERKTLATGFNRWTEDIKFPALDETWYIVGVNAYMEAGGTNTGKISIYQVSATKIKGMKGFIEHMPIWDRVWGVNWDGRYPMQWGDQINIDFSNGVADDILNYTLVFEKGE